MSSSIRNKFEGKLDGVCLSDWIDELASKYQDYQYVPDIDLGWFKYKEEVLECWGPNCKATVIEWHGPAGGNVNLKAEGPTKELIVSFINQGWDKDDVEWMCREDFIKK